METENYPVEQAKLVKNWFHPLRHASANCPGKVEEMHEMQKTLKRQDG